MQKQLYKMLRISGSGGLGSTKDIHTTPEAHGMLWKRGQKECKGWKTEIRAVKCHSLSVAGLLQSQTLQVTILGLHKNVLHNPG